MTEHDADDMPLPDGRPASALRSDEALSDELCLFVHSLAMDGRPLPPRLLERARVWATEHPACAQAVRDFERLHEVLASEPARPARAGFTARVLRGLQRRTSSERVLPLVLRLSLAAALLLAFTLAFDLHFPGRAEAGADLARQSHVADTLRPDPFGEPQLEAALRRLFPDPVRLAPARGDGGDPGTGADAQGASPQAPVAGEGGR